MPCPYTYGWAESAGWIYASVCSVSLPCDGYGDVGHGGAVGGAVPVILSRGYDHHVALFNNNFLCVVDDFANAFGDDQDLIAAVLVEFVP